jgi:hypothetical protein
VVVAVDLEVLEDLVVQAAVALEALQQVTAQQVLLI